MLISLKDLIASIRQEQTKFPMEMEYETIHSLCMCFESINKKALEHPEIPYNHIVLYYKPYQAILTDLLEKVKKLCLNISQKPGLFDDNRKNAVILHTKIWIFEQAVTLLRDSKGAEDLIEILLQSKEVDIDVYGTLLPQLKTELEIPTLGINKVHSHMERLFVLLSTAQELAKDPSIKTLEKSEWLLAKLQRRNVELELLKEAIKLRLALTELHKKSGSITAELESLLKEIDDFVDKCNETIKGLDEYIKSINSKNSIDCEFAPSRVEKTRSQNVNALKLRILEHLANPLRRISVGQVIVLQRKRKLEGGPADEKSSIKSNKAPVELFFSEQERKEFQENLKKFNNKMKSYVQEVLREKRPDSSLYSMAFEAPEPEKQDIDISWLENLRSPVSLSLIREQPIIVAYKDPDHYCYISEKEYRRLPKNTSGKTKHPQTNEAVHKTETMTLIQYKTRIFEALRDNYKEQLRQKFKSDGSEYKEKHIAAAVSEVEQLLDENLKTSSVALTHSPMALS